MNKSNAIFVNLKKLNGVDNLIYFAADENYYLLYGKRLITSAFRKNKNWGIHVHIFNPTQNTLIELDNYNNLSYSHEKLKNSFFLKMYKKFLSTDNKEYQQKTLLLLKKMYGIRFCNVLSKLLIWFSFLIYLSPKKILIKHFKNIYFSCNRFVILNDLVNYKYLKSKNILSLDADSLINKKLPNFKSYKKNDMSLIWRSHPDHKYQPFLASNIYLPSGGMRRQFLNLYAITILKSFSTYEVNWGLDQIILGLLVPKYNWKQLEPSLCSLDFDEDAYIWSAKGKRKHNEKFLR